LFFFAKSFLFVIGKIFKKSLINPPLLSGIDELIVSPSVLLKKNTSSGTPSDSHLLGQDSEGDMYLSEHGSGGSLGFFSFRENSTTTANMQQGIVGKVAKDDFVENNNTRTTLCLWHRIRLLCRWSSTLCIWHWFWLLCRLSSSLCVWRCLRFPFTVSAAADL
jgi:hypothetical protein